VQQLLLHRREPAEERRPESAVVAGEEHEGVQEEEGVHLLAGLIGAHDDVQQQRQHLASQLQLP
jgi:hypothetical protein